MTAVAGLLLAAGGGSRLGRAKALVSVAGESLVERGLRMLRTGGCDPLLVVLGAAPVLVPQPTQAVLNPDWATGMASSLRAGLAALEALPADAVVLALADQPLVGPEAVRRLIAVWRGGATAAVGTYDGHPRNPVLLDRRVWAAVAAAACGDEGARPWLRAHPGEVVAVPCGDTGSPYDVDTPADLDHVTALLARQKD